MAKGSEREIYCSFEYFMRHGCRGCKLGRKCDEYDSRIKRDRININNSDINNFNSKKFVGEVNKNDKTKFD